MLVMPVHVDIVSLSMGYPAIKTLPLAFLSCGTVGLFIHINLESRLIGMAFRNQTRNLQLRPASVSLIDLSVSARKLSRPET